MAIPPRGPRRRSRPGARARFASICAAALAGLFVACGPHAEWDWRTSQATRDALDEADVARIDELLRELFGTALAPAPRTPAALAEAGIDLAAPDFGQTDAALAAAVRKDNEREHPDLFESLARDGARIGAPPKDLAALQPLFDRAAAGEPGARDRLADALREHRPSFADAARIYARQCLACHGREGGGDGPTAAQLRPPPRDFRSGGFQRYRPDLAERPTQKELVQVVHGGIVGTGMPSFRAMSSGDLARVADYVRLLALRGEVERRLVEDRLAGRPIDLAVGLAHLERAAAPWVGLAKQDAAVARPASSPADSAARGAASTPP